MSLDYEEREGNSDPSSVPSPPPPPMKGSVRFLTAAWDLTLCNDCLSRFIWTLFGRGIPPCGHILESCHLDGTQGKVLVVHGLHVGSSCPHKK